MALSPIHTAGRTQYWKDRKAGIKTSRDFVPTHMCEGEPIMIFMGAKGWLCAYGKNMRQFSIKGKFYTEIVTPPTIDIDAEAAEETIEELPSFMVNLPFLGLCTAMAALNAPHGYAEHHTGWVGSSANREARTVLLTWPQSTGGRRLRLKFEESLIVTAEKE